MSSDIVNLFIGIYQSTIDLMLQYSLFRFLYAVLIAGLCMMFIVKFVKGVNG